MSVVYFLVLVAVLILVHELGHFVWAKFFDVRVLRFSLGFGPTLIRIRKGETLYTLKAIPLGGYVTLAEDREKGEKGEHSNPPRLWAAKPARRSRSFQEQEAWRRFVIIVAGPLANIAFASILLFSLHLSDPEVPAPSVGEVLPGHPAAGRLLPGDRILAIDGRSIHSFNEVSDIISDSGGRSLSFKVERFGERRIERVHVHRVQEGSELGALRERGQVGILPHHPLAVISVESTNTPAYLAGLRSFDMVVAANGKPVQRWVDLEHALDKQRGMTPLVYLRPHSLPRALGGLASLDVFEPHMAALNLDSHSAAEGPANSGLRESDLVVARVLPGSAAAQAGVQPGDRLFALDARPLRSWSELIDTLERSPKRDHWLYWKREGRSMEGRLLSRGAALAARPSASGSRAKVAWPGLARWRPTVDDAPVSMSHDLLYAARRALHQTWEMIELTGVSMKRLFQGRLPLEAIGGPLTLFEMAGVAGREGVDRFFLLMAFLSINLALLNLLPIPLLDGGQALLIAVEALSRRALSPALRSYASVAGLSLLILLMALAVRNDMLRQWPPIQERSEHP